MEDLHEACRTSLSGVALSHEPPHQNKYVPRRLNLERLMSTAAESGHLSCVQALLKFGQVHNLHYNAFSSRDEISAALKSKNDAILKEYIKA